MFIPAASGAWQNVPLEAFSWVALQKGLLAKLHLKEDEYWIEVYKGRTSKDGTPYAKPATSNTYEFVASETGKAFGLEFKIVKKDRYVLCFRIIGPYVGTGF